MSRPLVISDCDEVLLRMLTHFRDYARDAHDVNFHWEGGSFDQSMRYIDGGAFVPEAEMLSILNAFFDNAMDTQTPIPGAIEAMGQLGEVADVVVLTNLMDHRAQKRTEQLASHGIHVPVFTNQGPKGPALKRILEERQPSRAFFIDDIARHHASVAQDASDVTRLHFVGEPEYAPHVECAFKAGDAHARIDNWAEALPWLLEQLNEEQK